METKFDAKAGTLTIVVPLLAADKAPLSASGKNRVLFSSGGFTRDPQFRINLTVIPAKA